MKLIKYKTLNEKLAEMNKNDQGVANPVYADAVRSSAENKKKFEDVVKGTKYKMPNENRDAHKKVFSNEQLKKMHLSESLFTEWVEDSTPLTESFAQPDIVLEKEDHVFEEETGDILVDKSIFDDYMENAYINIKFVEDNDDKVLQYKMISEDDQYIRMEYIGEAEPGIDEEIAGCQKYPVESPFDKEDSNLIKRAQKYPVEHEEAPAGIKEAIVSESNVEPLSVRLKKKLKQMKNESLTEEFNNWDSPESRVERYITDLPELIDIMYDHFKRGNIEAQAFADALKIAYDTLDSVPQLDEELDASQKYPVETPWEAKDSQFISAKDKTPKDQVVSKDSQYISAGDKDPNTYNKDMKESVEEVELEEAKKIENPTYIYMSERDPLGDIIQAELTEGEWAYVQSPEGKVSLTRLPSANYPDHKVTCDWDRNDRYAIFVFAESEEALQPAIDIAKKYNKEFKIEKVSRPLPGKEYSVLIYVDEIEDFEKPYFDPNVKIRSGKKKKAEVVDDEFEECVKPQMPVEESVEENSDSLNEIRISTEGLANFKPFGQEAMNTWARILEANKVEIFEQILEEKYPEGIGYTELNDMLSKDPQLIFDMLDITDEMGPSEISMDVPSFEVDDEFDFSGLN